VRRAESGRSRKEEAAGRGAGGNVGAGGETKSQLRKESLQKGKAVNKKPGSRG
jgi:hypothetical protein